MRGMEEKERGEGNKIKKGRKRGWVEIEGGKVTGKRKNVEK